MAKPRIVIIGGGFGGVYQARYCLRKLRNADSATICLVNPKNYFLFSPMLHEVATGGLNQYNIVTPIRDVLCSKNFHFILDSVDFVDVKNKFVVVGKKKYVYDYLVFAQGAHANVPLIPGAAEHCLKLKTIDDAAAIRDRIIKMLEQAAWSKDRGEQKRLLTFILIGGGPTGVELAGELSQFLHQTIKCSYPELKNELVSIHLVHGGEKLVPVLLHDPSIKKCQRELEKKKVTVTLNSRVARVGTDFVEYTNTKTRQKERLIGSTIIWTAGITPNVIKGTKHYLDKNMLFQIDNFLRVKGLKSHYALGDCALSINPSADKPNPATAQLATRQAIIAAKNIVAEIKGKQPREFFFKPQGFLVSVGEYYAVAEVFSLWFSGVFAWWMWRTIYLTKLLGWANKIKVAADWTVNLFFKRDTSQMDGEK